MFKEAVLVELLREVVLLAVRITIERVCVILDGSHTAD